MTGSCSIDDVWGGAYPTLASKDGTPTVRVVESRYVPISGTNELKQSAATSRPFNSIRGLPKRMNDHADPSPSPADRSAAAS